MTIETINGSVTTKGSGSRRISVFYRQRANDKDLPLHLAEKDPKSGIKDLKTLDIIQAGARKTNNLWSRKRHDFPDGSYIKINITTMKKGSAAFLHQMNNIYLRPRATGPLIRLSIDLPTDENSNLAVAYFEGRFDIVDLEEIDRLGLAKNPAGSNDIATYDPEDYADFVTVTKLEKEIVPIDKPKEQVVKSLSGGDSKILLKRTRRRNIRG